MLKDIDEIRIPPGWSALVMHPNGSFGIIIPIHEKGETVSESEIIITGLGAALKQDRDEGTQNVFEFASASYKELNEEEFNAGKCKRCDC